MCMYIHNGILCRHEKEGNLQCATTWTDLEGIMRSETNQTKKDKYYMISFTCGI